MGREGSASRETAQCPGRGRSAGGGDEVRSRRGDGLRVSKLRRHIDRNALARAQLSCEGYAVPWPQERNLTRVKPPRRATTYRAARKNKHRKAS